MAQAANSKISNAADLELSDGVLRDSAAGGNRLILWIPVANHPGYWDRVATVAGKSWTPNNSMASIDATRIRTRVEGGRMAKFFDKLRRRSEKIGWLLPNGIAVDEIATTASAVSLIRATDATAGLDEASIATIWSDATKCERLGPSLFLVESVRDDRPGAASKSGQPFGPSARAEPPDANPRTQAEQFLATARAGNDPRRLVSALIDFGVICDREGDKKRAVELLAEAVQLARGAADRAGKSDALGSYAMALASNKQSQAAFEAVNEQLADARAANDPYQEKTALDVLGFVYSGLRQNEQAVEAYQKSRLLAERLGDAKHLATLNWYLAIHLAELGRREEALDSGRRALAYWQKVDDPHAAWYADHLSKFERGEKIGGEPQPASSGYLKGISGAQSFGATSGAPPAIEGPTLLRMAMSAAKAMAKFLGTGMKIVPEQVQKDRLAICNECEHHTGIRCRICGCFTNAKAWLPHEKCPLTKW